MEVLPKECLVITSFNMIIIYLSIRQPAKYFLTIHGKAATRCNANVIKGHSILIYNHTIPKQKNIKNIQIGKEKILELPLIKMATSILFLMNPMANTIYMQLKMA